MRLCPALALVALVATPASADPLPRPVAAALAAINEAGLRADLTFLASDALRGRMSLEPGDDAAIAWIAAEFAKAGLQPAAIDADGMPSYLQAVPLIEYIGDGRTSFIALGDRRFAPPS